LHDAWKNPENYLLVVNSERTLEVKQRFIKDFLSLSYNKTGGVLGGFMLPSDHGLKMFINNQELMNTLQILNESDRKKWNRTLVNMDINNEF